MESLNAINASEKLLSKIESGYLVVTAGKRLAREIHQQYHQQKVENGDSVWQTPQILPFQIWSSIVWQHLATDISAKTARPIVLDAQQTNALWQNTIRQDITKHHHDNEPLWSVSATASSASQAWGIAHQWQINFGPSNIVISDHAGFNRWAQGFLNHCNQHHWISAEQIPGAIAKFLKQQTGDEDQLSNQDQSQTTLDAVGLSNIPGIILCGFDELSPVQQIIFDLLEDLGLDIVSHEPEPRIKPAISTKAFFRQSEQWNYVADWAKNSLADDPTQRLAIVVPELQSCRSEIEQALTRALSPQYFTNGDDSRATFHISLGKPLSDFEVVRAALESLSLFSMAPQPAAIIHAFLMSPFIADADVKRNHRSSLDVVLRQFLPFQIKPQDLPKVFNLAKKRCGYDADDALDNILTSIEASHQQPTVKQPYSKWAEIILGYLDLLGWPGPLSLDSESFQAMEAFKSELQKFAGLDLVSEENPFDTVLAQLKSQLDSQIFEPQSLEPNLEVIDITESSGLEFDAIWFANLTENVWPRPVRPHPFLPISAQKESGYHFASGENSEALCSQQQQRLMKQTKQLILSYYCREDDVPVRPSPLIANISESAEQLSPTHLVSFSRLLDDKLIRQDFVDETGIPLNTEDASGGTSLIQSQAQCGFKAYALHRLNARETGAREQGLDPIDRGQLVHRVMEDCWREIHTSKNMRTLGVDGLSKLISEKIKQNNNAFISSSGCELGFFDSHSNWLQKLLSSWFDLEMNRNLAFVASALETPVELVLGGLRLKFKIDRVDHFEDGSLCIIDYKTGAAAKLNDWVGERPGYPQLALYALAIEEDHRFSESSISSVMVAQLKANDLRFRGLYNNAPFYIEEVKDRTVVEIEKAKLENEITDWQSLQNHWQDTLTALAENFRRGEAYINPLNEQVCAYCNLHSFCRIYEKGQKGQE